MGLFGHKQTDDQRTEDVAGAVERLFDEALREELRTQSREYFERVIHENAQLFKQDLDATIAHINTELRQQASRQLDEQLQAIATANSDLKEGIAARLDEQFAEYGKSLKEAEGLALESIKRSAAALEQQHSQLSASLEKSVANQDAQMATALEQNKTRIAAMNEAEDSAIESLKQSIHDLEKQHQQLALLLEKGIAEQKAVLVDGFAQNMAQIIEHYLLGALGDQYDLKAQVPAIIKQMEENKQAMTDDMKL